MRNTDPDSMSIIYGLNLGAQCRCEATNGIPNLRRRLLARCGRSAGSGDMPGGSQI